ncbi:hypothetical protein BV22DRAFT_1002238 [Leucogyrophana mollusca]|uniref:Uncharacterized protein n=1 Tax=Leucogyrophana mollusca TaxID=85980 RepID=A0ACB8BUK0_9AGAM|nr:hypothetical protein BV22DRAFT_1002238 [Leucogyrophana mollusca]
MKLSFALAPLFAAAAFAQNVLITAPHQNQTVGEGSSITVSIERPDFQSSSEEVAVVIALQPCRPKCFPGEGLGKVLYNGPYNPEVHSGNTQPYQNFTVQVTPGLMGYAVLSVTHMALIGVSLLWRWWFFALKLSVLQAGPIAWTEQQNVTLYVL